MAEESHETYSEKQVLDAWTAYTKGLERKNKKILSSILDMARPKIKDGVIYAELPNNTSKDGLESEKAKLMAFIKKEIRNTDIRLKITVNAELEKSYAITPKEKYEKLKEKNPLVEKLRKTFDLDI